MLRPGGLPCGALVTLLATIVGLKLAWLPGDNGHLLWPEYGKTAIPQARCAAAAPGLRQLDLRGKVALVTGANSGIGYEVARRLADANATVYLVCASAAKAEAAAAAIRRSSSRAARSTAVGRALDLRPLEADLASLDSVRSAAAQFHAIESRRLHLLVSNAGVFACPWDAGTVDGFDKAMAVNYLAPYLLVRLLLPRMAASGNDPGWARVVHVSSRVHSKLSSAGADELGPSTFRAGAEAEYDPDRQYQRSKLAQLVHENCLSTHCYSSTAD
jgi:NAD(P)-dependent dehydrogenase (short-subunit alcohol dehydrogenase family)